jgi:gas vesicle protein
MQMDRVYLLLAGILTGAALGLLSGRPALWICVGVVLGAVLAVAARPRTQDPTKSQQLKADS